MRCNKDEQMPRSPSVHLILGILTSSQHGFIRPNTNRSYFGLQPCVINSNTSEITNKMLIIVIKS